MKLLTLAARHQKNIFYNDDLALYNDRQRTAKRIRDARRDARQLARLFKMQGQLLERCVIARRALEQENETLRRHLSPKV